MESHSILCFPWQTEMRGKYWVESLQCILVKRLHVPTTKDERQTKDGSVKCHQLSHDFHE